MAKPIVYDEAWIKTLLGSITENYPHVVLIFDLPKALMVTSSFSGKVPAVEWLKERASKNDWVQTDLGIFEGGPYAVAFKDPDLAFEFKMRWA